MGKRFAGSPLRVQPTTRRVEAPEDFPKGGGYISKLYSLHEDGDGREDRLEQEFFMPVDARAADALAAIESGVSNHQWDRTLRLAWSRFLMSLLMRMPEDLAILRESYRREFALVTSDMESKYRERRRAGWPGTLTAALYELSSEAVADSSKILATMLMRNERVTNALSAMHWSCKDVTAAERSLLTSDRPVQLSGRFGEQKAKLILPIGPARLFIGASDGAQAQLIHDLSSNRLVARTNRAVTEAADKYVYGVDDSALEFVRRHFRQARPKPLMRQLAEYVGAKRRPS